ncbi:MAG: hypothetical protein E7663_04300 [Ruminococcaceae bacterium]|nr:hypothetical protein [Oscillospiraceae bacterium]
MTKKRPDRSSTPEVGNRSDKKRYLALLCINTLLFFCLYRISLLYAEMTDRTFFAFAVMIAYLAILLGFTVAFLIVNRFFYQNGVEREQLPDDWSEEKKDAFLQEGKRRLTRSRWMLTVIFPLVLTFLIDAVDLFIIDLFLRN